MIPFYHAAGDLHYAKASHLYLQEMLDLKKRLTHQEYECFVQKGYFSVRRTERSWAGNWTDMTIEQTLMRSMKTSGGLSHGRGVSPATLAQWFLEMPTCIEVVLNLKISWVMSTWEEINTFPLAAPLSSEI